MSFWYSPLLPGGAQIQSGGVITLDKTFKFYTNGSFYAASFKEGSTPLNISPRLFSNGQAQILQMIEVAGSEVKMEANGSMISSQFIE